MLPAGALCRQSLPLFECPGHGVLLSSRGRALGGLHYDTRSDYGSNEIASFVSWAATFTDAQMTSRAYDMLDYARAVVLIA